MPVGLGVDTVIVNNCVAMRQATEHLVEQGHTFFGLVGGPVEYMTGRERQAGFVAALQAAGIGEDRIIIENGDWHLNGSYAAASRLLARAPLPIALATANNDATIATLKVIRERRLRIPEDVALVCFDEMPWTAGYNPPLTVVDQHPYHIGAVAAELLLSRMRHPDRPVQQVMLEAELIVRESSRQVALTTTQ
jgi:DNA-binding LacI/PurR family transcriptional regulator